MFNNTNLPVQVDRAVYQVKFLYFVVPLLFLVFTYFLVNPSEDVDIVVSLLLVIYLIPFTIAFSKIKQFRKVVKSFYYNFGEDSLILGYDYNKNLVKEIKYGEIKKVYFRKYLLNKNLGRLVIVYKDDRKFRTKIANEDIHNALATETLFFVHNSSSSLAIGFGNGIVCIPFLSTENLKVLKDFLDSKILKVILI